MPDNPGHDAPTPVIEEVSIERTPELCRSRASDAAPTTT